MKNLIITLIISLTFITTAHAKDKILLNEKSSKLLFDEYKYGK